MLVKNVSAAPAPIASIPSDRPGRASPLPEATRASAAASGARSEHDGRPFRRRGTALTLLLIAVAVLVAAQSRWALSVVLVASCAVFVAFEFALVKTSVRQLERDAAEGRHGAGPLLQMKRDLNAMLAACQFGITLTSLGLTLALEPAIHSALSAHEAIAEHSAALSMALGTFFHVTFGELVPKGISLVVPAAVLYRTAPLMRMFRWVAVPFIKTCNGIANAVVAGLTGRHPDGADPEETVEIGEALFHAHQSGQIQPEQLTLMRNVLGFSERIAREVMTPAKDVVAVDLAWPWPDVLRYVEEHPQSRFLVTDGAWHNVVGYVRKSDVLRAELRRTAALRPIVRPIERRPETVSLDRIDIFRGCPIIALYDEHDSFVGLITAEDVVEQIVGEIYDEKDVQAPASVERLPDGSMHLDGELLLAEVSELLRLGDLSAYEDIDTIGGLVLKLLGREPAAGDEAALGDYDAVVLEAQGFRITKLHCAPRPRGEEPAEEDA